MSFPQIEAALRAEVEPSGRDLPNIHVQGPGFISCITKITELNLNFFLSFPFFFLKKSELAAFCFPRQLSMILGGVKCVRLQKKHELAGSGAFGFWHPS